ncbi:MAG: hypothetical protein ACOY4O_04305 [Pseudomonadota bacterium]|jgi:hypothetical protein
MSGTFCIGLVFGGMSVNLAAGAASVLPVSGAGSGYFFLSSRLLQAKILLPWLTIRRQYALNPCPVVAREERNGRVPVA